MIRSSLSVLISAALIVAVPVGSVDARDGRARLGVSQRAALHAWAADTWRSLDAMLYPETGLVADNIGGDLAPASRARYTSPTNIGMYIWATLVARDLQIITPREARARIAQTLATVAELERHAPSGQFWNWYDPLTGKKLTTWPETGDPVYPFASSVDNGWLASALLMVANGAVPQLRDPAWALVSSMDFGCYYDAAANAPAGLIRGGFWLEGGTPPNSEGFPRADYCAMGQNVVYTGHHYGAFNTEPRIASYIGIALGQIPPEHYFGPWRTFPDTCDWSWPEQMPVGEWVSYMVEGVQLDVFEGAYRYDDQLLVPTWGGSMFEALMVPLIVPEDEWGPGSWGITHPLYVEAQVEYGLEESGYGYWGFSPSSDPAGGYREYGVDAIGMEPMGYTSDQERQALVDYGWPDPACPRPSDPIEDFGSGVVTPHAAFLALAYDPAATLANVSALVAAFPELYGEGGFKDAVDVSSGDVADRYLALDQGMVMAAIGNALRNDRLQTYFSRGPVERALRPLMAIEEFGAGRTNP